MEFRLARQEEFKIIRDFYWNLIDIFSDRHASIGWKKGIYPSDDYLRESLQKGEMYVLTEDEKTIGCVIVNSCHNDGYEGVLWQNKFTDEEVLIPHALAVLPSMQGKGIGKRMVADIIKIAKERGKKVIRLDILSGNDRARKLYTGMGFRFVQAKEMYYEDTGWTQYQLFELIF